MKRDSKPLHWSEEKEIGKTQLPFKMFLLLFKILPGVFLRILAYPISFFYFLCSSRARNDATEYQKQFIAYTEKKYLKKTRPFRQILAFSLTLIEKIEGWAGKTTLKNICFHSDDIDILKAQLEQGKGAVILCSHLGNIELLRSLADYNQTGVSKPVKVTSIVDFGTTENFNKMIKKLNSRVDINIVNVNSIGPETIMNLMDDITKGGLVVAAGDRTSKTVPSRCFRKNFLGKQASFPYGVFLMTALLNAPIYFVYALRTKPTGLCPEMNMFVKKSDVNFDCTRKERNQRIEKLCSDYVQTLEYYCIKYPYQWYNFYDFWAVPEHIE